MKKILFLLTSINFVLCYGQEAKWELTDLKLTKKGMGRLNLEFPDSVEWIIDLYTSNNKFITNRSYNDRRNESDKSNFYDLPVGNYHVKLNTVLVQNVPIEEGKLTRVKAGLLKIDDARWELRTDSGKKYLTSGTSKRKMMLPIGSYQLGKATNYRVVHINDLIGYSELNTSLDPDVELSPYFEMTDGPQSLGENGKLEVILFPISALPIDVELGQPFQWDWEKEKVLFDMRLYPKTGPVYHNYELANTNDSALIFSPGIYRVKINDFFVPGTVSVMKGKTTRIRAGFLKVTKGSIDVAFKIYTMSGTYGPVKSYSQVVVLPLRWNNNKYKLIKYKLTHEYASDYDYDETHFYEVDVINDRKLVVNGKKTLVHTGVGRLTYQY